MATSTVRCSRIVSDVRLYRSSQAVSVANGKAFIFGGELLPRQPVDNKFDIINLEDDLATRIETVTAPNESPTPRVGSPSTTIGNGIWLFSGRGGLEMKPIEESGALWRYDVDQRHWEFVKPADSAAPHPSGRSYHCITSDGSKNIYIHAGCPEEGRLSDLWVFDTVARSWTELPGAPPPARGGASIAYSQSKLYRTNGFDGQTEQGGSVDVFDVVSCSWDSITYSADGVEGPEPRSVGVLLPALIGDRQHLITMFGERDPSSLGHAGAGKMLSDIWSFDLGASEWKKRSITGSCPEGRGWFDADVYRDARGHDTVIVHGGLNEQNQRLGDVWQLAFE